LISNKLSTSSVGFEVEEEEEEEEDEDVAKRGESF
jgi:hypothetical protein